MTRQGQYNDKTEIKTDTKQAQDIDFRGINALGGQIVMSCVREWYWTSKEQDVTGG